MKIRSVAEGLVLLALAGLAVLTVICARPEIIRGNAARVCYGRSMEPTIMVGDMLISKPHSEIEVGEVIFYNYEGSVMAHRVVEVSDGYYRTKGDANPEPDSWIVPEEAVLGTYWLRLPYFGYVVHFIKSKYFSAFCFVVGSYLMASSGWDIYKILSQPQPLPVAIKRDKRGRWAEVALAWEWRWDWWRMATMRPPVLCVCGLRLNPRNQRFCVRCGKEVRG